MPIAHPFPPLFDGGANILILGSFPSVKSRETMFFYGHKQNRFWRVMAELLCYHGMDAHQYAENVYVPQTVEEKTDMLLKGHVALWDTIASCDIVGSSDQSISNVVPNDLSVILKNADIRKICCNGTKSYELFMRYIAADIRTDKSIGGPDYKTKRVPEFIKLPSTSPANAAWSSERLAASWRELTGLIPIGYDK